MKKLPDRSWDDLANVIKKSLKEKRIGGQDPSPTILCVSSGSENVRNILQTVLLLGTDDRTYFSPTVTFRKIFPLIVVGSGDFKTNQEVPGSPIETLLLETNFLSRLENNEKPIVQRERKIREQWLRLNHPPSPRARRQFKKFLSKKN